MQISHSQRHHGLHSTGLSQQFMTDTETATRELKELIEKNCGGIIEYEILDTRKREIEI